MIKATKNHYYIGITIALILLIAIVGIFSMIGINEPTKTAYALSGSGTEENPYLIDTKADLEDFRDAVNNNGETTACALLTSNIDLGDDQWTPIGTGTSNSYTGTFDGAGHTVTLNINVTGSSSNQGLFGYIGGSGIVKRVLVEGSIDSTWNYVGGIAGTNLGRITDCVNKATLQANGYIGGIAGSSQGTIENCYNTGTVTATGTEASCSVGGIIGNTSSGATVQNCYNTGAISLTGNTEGPSLGGIIGYAGRNVDVKNCFNYGTVTGTGSKIGGIVGSQATSSPGTISNNYYLTGTVTIGGEIVNGGFNSADVAGKAEQLSAEQFKQQASFSNWDFTDIWTMGQDYPVFLKMSDGYVESLINQIDNPVVYPSSKDKIEAAREAYNNLFDSDKSNVDNYNILEQAEEDYANLEAGALVEWNKLVDGIIVPNNPIYDGNPKTITLGTYDDTKLPGVTTIYQKKNGTDFENTDSTINVGDYKIIISVTGTEFTTSREFSIAKVPAPAVQTEFEATYGDTLSTIALSNGWGWDDDPSTSVGNAGENIFTASYIPTDTENYESIISTNITINVQKASTPNYDLPTGIETSENNTLADVALPAGWRWVDSTINVGQYGEKQFKAIYNPDTNNYEDSAEENITVIVSHIHNEITFTAWTNTDSLPYSEGNYFLTTNVTLSSTWTVPTGTTKLCLNGNGIIGNSTFSLIYVGSGATLYIYDCSTNTHKFSVNNGLATVNDDLESDYLTFVGGYITGGYQEVSFSAPAMNITGGGIVVMNGGNIIGNHSYEEIEGSNCGAIHVHETGHFTIKGGSIQYNVCQNNGAAIFVRDGGVLDISGGTISHNTSTSGNVGGIATDVNGTINMSGNPTIVDNGSIDLKLFKKITIAGQLTNTTPIRVHMEIASETTGAFTEDWATYMFDINPATYFDSDDHEIVAIGGEVHVHDHNYGDLIASTSTCDTGGLKPHYYCADCGMYFDENKVPTTYEALWRPAGHYLVHHAQVEPTCTVTGKKEHFHCSLCDKYFDVNMQEIASGNLYKLNISALGHDYDYENAVFTWTEADNSYGWTATVSYHCNRCGNEINTNASITQKSASWNVDSYICAYIYVNSTYYYSEPKYRDSDIGTATINKWTPWEYDDHLPTEKQPSGSQGWYLTKDVTLAATWTVPASGTKLCLNGHVVTMTGSGSAIYVPLGSWAFEFTLCEYNFDETHYYYIGKAVTDSHNNTLNFVGQIVDDESDPAYVAAARKGSFEGGYITGGTGRVIGGNTYGGAVYVEGDSSKSYSYSSKFTLQGATLFGNHADYGGAVYVATNAYFKTYGDGGRGGYIIGNQAGSEGGGVYANKRNYSDTYPDMNEGMLTQTGSIIIAHNTAGQSGNGYGGAIAGWVCFNFSYAKVYGNAAIGTNAKGGAIYGFLRQEEASIYENYTTGVGPGVYVTNRNLCISANARMNMYSNFYAESIAVNEILPMARRGDIYFATGYKMELKDSSYPPHAADGVKAYIEMQAGTGNFMSTWSNDHYKVCDFFAANIGYKINESGANLTLTTVSGNVNIDISAHKYTHIYTTYYGLGEGSTTDTNYYSFSSSETNRYVFSGTQTIASKYVYIMGYNYGVNNVYLRFSNLNLTSSSQYIFYLSPSYGPLNVYIELVGDSSITTNGTSVFLVSNTSDNFINVYFTGTGTITFNNTADNSHGINAKNICASYANRVGELHIYNTNNEDITIYERVAQIIQEIGYEVTFTKEIRTRIETARAAYDALSEELKLKVVNRDYLTYAEEAYKLAAVQGTIDYIDSIPTPIALTPECKVAIEAAREAYDYLDDEEMIAALDPDIPQELVYNKQKLFDAENEYATLQLAAWNDLVENGIALPDQLDYDGTEKVINLTYDTTILSVTVVYQKKNENNEYETIDSCVDAGDYKAVIYSAVNGEPISTEVLFTIEKIDPIIPTGFEAGYGQTLADVALPEGWTWDDDESTVVGNVGEQTFTISYAETTNYKAVNSVEVTITVSTGNPSASAFNYAAPDNLSYTGTAKAASITTEEIGMGEITIHYYSDASRETEVSPINAGTYYIGISVAAGDNYNATSSIVYADDWTFEIATIDSASTDFNYTAPENLTYTGTAKVASVTTEKVGMGEITIHYYSDSARETEVSPINAGTYYVGISTVAGDNYNATSSIVYADDWTFEIAKAPAPAPGETPNTIDVGENLTLADIELPDGWIWVDSLDTPIGNIGEHQFNAIYNPNKTNYEDSDPVTVTLIVQHLHNGIKFTVWTETSSLPTEEGNYYLSADVVLDETWTVPNGTTNLCLNGYGIKMNADDKSVITIGSGATLNVYDCGQTVHYFDVHSDGYAININENSDSGRNSFTGGYITGGQGTYLDYDRVLGGGVFVNGGTLHMYGGTVIGNFMTRSFVKGAGVWVGYDGTFTMEEGAAIKYNWSDNVGGGVCVGVIFDDATCGTFIMNGGEISHNRASAGGAIMLRSGDIVINGGTITDNIARDSGGAIDYEYQSYSSLSISGNPIINNNFNYNSEPSNIVLRGNTTPKIVLSGALTSGANISVLLGTGFPPVSTIGIFTDGWPTYMDGKNPADYFSSSVYKPGCSIYLRDGEACYGVPTQVHDNITFEGWTSTNSLPTSAGNYYLFNDVTISSTWTVPSGTTNLCLNGYGIKMSGEGSVVSISSECTLNIYDCDNVTTHKYTISNPTTNGAGLATIDDTLTENFSTFTGGYITGGNSGEGGGISVNGGTLTINGGNIIGNRTSGKGGGGGICVRNGTLTLNGGAIIGNYADYSTGAQGGGVSILASASLYMHGGTIEKNYSTGCGGGIQSNMATVTSIDGGIIRYNHTTQGGGINSGIAVTFAGGSIYGNIATGNGGGGYFGPNITISGDAIIQGNLDANAKANDICLHGDNARIVLQDALNENNNTPIAVSRYQSAIGIITTGWSTYMNGKNPADSFVSTIDNPEYSICLKDGEAYYGIPVASVTKGDVTTEYGSFTDALSAWTANTTLTLLADVTSDRIDVTNGVTKTLDLNGKTITLVASNVNEQRVICVTKAGTTLNLIDSSGTNAGRLTGVNPVNDDLWSGALYINSGSIVNMYGGTISGNTSTNGAAVWIDGRGHAGNAQFNMYGGLITGNTATNGGGVYIGCHLQIGSQSIATPIFNMYGGTIAGNTATNGNNVYVDYGVLNMIGGTIDGGVAWNNEHSSDYVTVTFDANNGTGNMSAQYIKINTDTQVKDNEYYDFNAVLGDGYARAGYLLIGWNTQEDGLGDRYLVGESTINISEDTTLYAEWALIVASVTINNVITYYASLAEAYDACPNGGTIVLMNDVDLTDLGDNVYLAVEKDITIDLNGYILTFNSSATTSQITLDGHILTFENNAPTIGGVKGMVNVLGEGYLLLKDCRLSISKSQLEASSSNHIADHYIIEEINEDGFLSLVRPITDVEIVERLINEIPDPVEDTPECKEKIDAARKAYDDLPDDEKDDVENRQDLFDAEDEYARLHNVKWMITMRAKASIPSSYYDYINGDETIVRVYDVSLYRIAIDNGVEQTPVLTQPSDIKKDGTGTITVKLTIPDILLGKTFRILHVHAADDYEFISFTTDSDNKHITIRDVNRLSDFAFVVESDLINPTIQPSDNPSDPTNQTDPTNPSDPTNPTVQPIDLESETKITKEDDPTKENLPLVPQGQEQSEQNPGEPVTPPAVTISLEDTDPEDAEGITVEVEVKTEVSDEIKESENRIFERSLQSDDEIAIVYEVKLIRTTIEGGIEVKEEIQPSDIKPGTVVVINMLIPENLRGKPFKLLHIHSDEDIKEVTTYTTSEDGTTVTIRVDRLSEFAFIGKAASNENGNDNGGENTDTDEPIGPNKISDGAIAGIVIGGSIGLLLLGLLIFFLLRRRKSEDDNDGIDNASTKKKVEKIESSNSMTVTIDKEREQPIATADNTMSVVTPLTTISDEDEDEENVLVVDAKGNIFNIRYIKSFKAKLIQSSDEVKAQYAELKNEIMSYNKTTDRLSWSYDSVNSGRTQLVKFAIRGKTLCVYYALNADDYADTKYKVEKTEAAKYENVPCMYRIKNERRLGYAKDLFAVVAEKNGLVKDEPQSVDYYLPYESTEKLIKEKLIKELKTTATEAQIQRAKTTETIQYAKPTETIQHVAQVSVFDASILISDEIAESSIEVDQNQISHTGKKGIVNVDTLSKSFSDGDTITLDSLKARKLVPSSVKQVKLLARGILDKKLHIELQDYSIEAVKMVIATGGTVKRV